MSSPAETRVRPSPRAIRRRRRFGLGLMATIGLSVAVAVGYRFAGRGVVHAAIASPGSDLALPRVEVVAPKLGSIERFSVQPGSLLSFESVELQAMVSGFLKTQNVDIGSRVKKGQVLAVIDVPREENAVKQAAALMDQAKVHARLAEAKVKSMEADRDAAAAALAQTEADLGRLVANHKYARAKYERIQSLVDQQAVDKRLLDEQSRDLESAAAAEETARLAIKTARSQLASAGARIEQAKVDAAEAQSAVHVAESRLAKAQVDVDYAKIIAPFDGVVTHRGFHPGAFIRSASDGAQPPLLTVARVDLMRVVVRVPDRDVVLVNPGDPVVLSIDGLEGRTFRGAVARIASAEESATRTMRVEIDLPNPDGRLREGMYGRASIRLEPIAKRLTIPAGCILDRSDKGQAVVQIVREGKVHRARVQLAAEDGTRVEVASGLRSNDLVILHSSIPLEEGMAVNPRTSG